MSRFTITTTGNRHDISWQSTQIPKIAYTHMLNWAKKQTDYSTHARVVSSSALASLDTGHILSLRNIVIKDKIIKNYPRMNAAITRIAAKYDAGDDILYLSRKYDFPPLNLLRGILLQKYAAAEIYKVFTNRQPSDDILSARDCAQFRRAEEHDAESSINQTTIARVAAENENIFVKFFTSLGVKLRTQEELAAEQVAEHGRAINTPDILFVDEVYINGVRIHWIDYKDYMGTNIKFLHKSNAEQAARYVAEWGPGAMCYHRSYVSGVEILETLLLDANALPIILNNITQPTEKWYKFADTQSLRDATETARTVYGVKIKQSEYTQFTIDEFENLHAENHRAVRGKSLVEIFPANDRPRGQQDIDSVKYHISHQSHPIILLKMDNSRWIVLDGVHRIIAAYIGGYNIRALICVVA